MKITYLNYAATSFPKPQCVINEMSMALSKYGNPARGVNDSSIEPLRMISGLREKIADFFDFSHPERVVFTKNATEALNTAIYGLAKPADHIVSTDLEHNSVLRPLYDLEKNHGVRVDFVAADKYGDIDYSEFSGLVRPDTKAVVCTHASNLIGNVLDIKRISDAAKNAGSLFVLDASQTVGLIPISMKENGIDILCFSGHKHLMGPEGTGGLLVSPDIDLKPLMRGGTGVASFEEDQPERYPEHLEAGTLNTPGLCGLKAALEYIEEEGLQKIKSHVCELGRMFYGAAKNIDGIRFYGSNFDFSKDRIPVIALNMDGIPASRLSDILSENYAIQVRAGGHCAPRAHLAVGTKDTGAVRFSFGYFTSEEDIEYAVKALKEIRESL